MTTCPTQGEHAQVAALTAAVPTLEQAKAIQRAIEVLDWLPTHDNQRPLWDKHQAALVGLRNAFAAPVQPAAPQGGAYAELPASLRAMAAYPLGHCWDALDAAVCVQAAAALDALRASNGQAPAGAQEGGPPGSGGWEKHAIEMERQRDYYRQRCDTMHAHQDGDVWFWQGDGTDHLESMGNAMTVVIRADQLRALSAPTAQPAPAATHPIAPDVAADLERSDWTPEEALRWYAAGKHYDTVPNGDGSSSARILDNGEVASNALRAFAEPAQARAEPGRLLAMHVLGMDFVTNRGLRARELARKVLDGAAPAAGAVAGPGWKMVPIDMNADMKHAARINGLDEETLVAMWHYLLAAAPTPAAQGDAEDAARWRSHRDKLDALVAYCPTCCQGFVSTQEMTRDQIIFECGKAAGKARVRAVKEALQLAVDHIDMDALTISHCKDAEAIRAALAQKEGK